MRQSRPALIRGRRRPRGERRRFALALLVAGISTTAAQAGGLPGDLDGDGAVEDADVSLMAELFGSLRGDRRYHPAADLDGDGDIDVADVALLGATFGSSGEPDTRPPRLRISLERVPDGMKELLVVPPERFRITLEFDADGGSLVDLGSLAVRSDRDMGPFAAGANLAASFDTSPKGATWEIPAGFDLDRTSHRIAVSLRDRAGNEATGSYGFAVRDFAFGPPLGHPQTIFLDFDRDRSLAPLPDFIEDLRRYGLSSAVAPEIEARMLALAVDRILEKMHLQYGRNADGSRAEDSANVRFHAAEPAAPHSRICVGGESPQGAAVLGAVSFDAHNLVENSDECETPVFGVFPQALDDLWWDDPDFAASFAAVDPELGGAPVGEHPMDASIFDPDFDLDFASAAQTERLHLVFGALDAFSGAVATAASHEVGHMLGVAAEGPSPAGHYGDNLHHNRNPDGLVPEETFIMNPGSSFSFAQVSGISDEGLARFRPLNWAYLRDRIAPSELVTGLHPAPVVLRVEPPIAVLRGRAMDVRFLGHHFVAGVVPPIVELIRTGDSTPAPVHDLVLVDRGTLRGSIDPALVSPGLYDVRYVGPDGQVVTLKEGLEVR